MSTTLASLMGIDRMGLRLPPYFSIMRVEAFLIAFALFLDSPATRIAFSIWLVSAFARASGEISNRFERASKALTVLRSAVFCERIVVTRMTNGSLWDFVHFGKVREVRSVCRIIVAHSFVLVPSLVSVLLN